MRAFAYRLRDGLIFVPVRIGEQAAPAEAFDFVLDTGTARTILNLKHVRKLGIDLATAHHLSRVRSVVGEEPGVFVRVPLFEALGWFRGDFELACHAFPEEEDIDGLLGADFFAGLRLTIDYGAGTVELEESASQP
jgi:hypothetical protein